MQKKGLSWEQMQIADDIVDRAEALKTQFLDLRGLAEHSSLGVSTLREYIRTGSLPGYKIKGKIIIRVSEFNEWLERFRINKSQDINAIVDDVMDELKS